jgi:hypothetical protein
VEHLGRRGREGGREGEDEIIKSNLVFPINAERAPRSSKRRSGHQHPPSLPPSLPPSSM